MCVPLSVAAPTATATSTTLCSPTNAAIGLPWPLRPRASALSNSTSRSATRPPPPAPPPSPTSGFAFMPVHLSASVYRNVVILIFYLKLTIRLALITRERFYRIQWVMGSLSVFFYGGQRCSCLLRMGPESVGRWDRQGRASNCSCPVDHSS